MPTESEFDGWSASQSYDHYMGRWSRKIAASFLDWLAPPTAADWVEIGCGTGALTETILANAAPRRILAVDQSPDFLAHARAAIGDSRARFELASAAQLPCADRVADVVTSALVLNFVPDRPGALREMQRVLRPGGLLSFYVWEYPGGGMGFIDAFWQAAARIDPDAAALNEAARFPFCTANGIAGMCSQAGIVDAEIAVIEIETRFPDFDSFWRPFTLGAGPAPGYCNSLTEANRAKLKEQLADDMGPDGPIVLPARAVAARARAPR